MPRQFTEIKLWPYKAPSPRACVRCSVQVREGEQSRRRRATVTAIDITDGSRLPVAYCGKHIPPDLAIAVAEASPGTGSVICQGCGEPTKNHSLMDNCIGD